MIRAPTRLIVFSVLPVVIPGQTRVVCVDALHASGFARRTVLHRIRHVRLRPIVTTILRGRTVLANEFARIGRVPTFLRIRNQECFCHCVLSILRHALNGKRIVRPIYDGVGRVCVVAFTRFLMSFIAKVSNNFKRKYLLRRLLAFVYANLFVVAGDRCLHAQGVDRALRYSKTARARAGGARASYLRLQDDRSRCALLSYQALKDFSGGNAVLPFPLDSLLYNLRDEDLTYTYARCRTRSRRRQFGYSRVSTLFGMGRFVTAGATRARYEVG